jgi:hypothetical protein
MGSNREVWSSICGVPGWAYPSSSRYGGRGNGVRRLEAMDLDGIGGKIESLLLVGEELLYGVAVIALELDHLASLVIIDNGAIAVEILLEGLYDLLQIESGGDAFDSGQGLAAIALWGRESETRSVSARLDASYAMWKLTLNADVDVWQRSQYLGKRDKGSL